MVASIIIGAIIGTLAGYVYILHSENKELHDVIKHCL